MFISFLLYMYSIYSYNRYVNHFSDFYTAKQVVKEKELRFFNLHLEKRKEKINMCEILDRIENRGKKEGIRMGREMEQQHISKLIVLLSHDGSLQEIEKIGEDPAYCQQLLQKYNLI